MVTREREELDGGRGGRGLRWVVRQTSEEMPAEPGSEGWKVSRAMGIARAKVRRWDRAGVFVGTARRPESTGSEREGPREGRVRELCLAPCGIPPGGMCPLEVRMSHELQACFLEWVIVESHLVWVVWVLPKKATLQLRPRQILVRRVCHLRESAHTVGQSSWWGG